MLPERKILLRSVQATLGYESTTKITLTYNPATKMVYHFINFKFNSIMPSLKLTTNTNNTGGTPKTGINELEIRSRLIQKF